MSALIQFIIVIIGIINVFVIVTTLRHFDDEE